VEGRRKVLRGAAIGRKTIGVAVVSHSGEGERKFYLSEKWKMNRKMIRIEMKSTAK
jgi:capsular polysaccharide biosynthesis protein